MRNLVILLGILNLATAGAKSSLSKFNEKHQDKVRRHSREVSEYCKVGSTLIPVNDKVGTCNCVCESEGVIVCRRKICPSLPEWCKRVVYPQGQCCPVCDCYFNGVLYQEGSTWFPFINDLGCEECTCTNGRAVCVPKVCPKCYKDAERKPGQCCSACAINTFTVKPTKKPHLTLPPPPPWLVGK